MEDLKETDVELLFINSRRTGKCQVCQAQKQTRSPQSSNVSMSRLNKFVLLRLHSSFHAASPHWHTVQPSQSFCLANVLRWLLIGQNDLWHTISSSSWPLCVTLLMATLKTEATLTTSHLMVLVLINVTRAKNDSEVNGNLKQLLRIHTHTHTCSIAHKHISASSLFADIILAGILKKAWKIGLSVPESLSWLVCTEAH